MERNQKLNMRVSLILMVILVGCTSSTSSVGGHFPDAPTAVWMLTKFPVGKQCAKAGSESEFVQKQAETKEKLNTAGIQIYEEVAIKGAACRGCDCPAFNAHYYVRINPEMASNAAELGFSQAVPPANDYRN